MSEEIEDIRAQLRVAQSESKDTQTKLVRVKRRQKLLCVGFALGGFLLFTVGGHWFPGYQLDGTAELAANKRASAAVSEVMALLCAERFLRPAGLEVRLTSLSDASSDWSKTNYVQGGDWAKQPGGAQADQSTAEKCRVRIGERTLEQPSKAAS